MQSYKIVLPLCITWMSAAWANTAPVADFDISYNKNLKITLTNSSTDPDGNALKYKWNFGDSTTSKEQNPDHTYAKSGTYKVSLKVSDGQLTNTISKKVTVNSYPVSDFAVVSQNDLQVSFESLASDPDGDALKYKWNFGDSTTSKEQNPVHTYANGGTYKVSLKVSDGKLTNTFSKKVTVNSDPVSDFAVVSQNGPTVRFESRASDPDGDALKYKWYFGDDTTSKEQNPEHIYAKAGTYKVTLKVSDGIKTVKSAKKITVKVNHAPTADFVISGISGRKVSLVNNSIDPDGDALVYKWYFGDGTTSREVNPVHTYQADGMYSVTLKASDGINKTVKIEKDVTVKSNRAPVAAFGVSGVNGLAVNLENRSSDPDGDALKYKWNFGDGTTSKDANPSHTYDKAGEYTVKLKVSDGVASSTASYKVKVGGGSGTTDLWVSATGVVNEELIQLFPQMHDSCTVDQGDIIVSGDAGLNEYHAYVWNDSDGAHPVAAWPGDDITYNTLNGCSLVTRVYSPFANQNKTLADYDMIIINGGASGLQTADLAGLSQDKNCVTVKNIDGRLVGELSSATECGVHVNGIPDEEISSEVYVYHDGMNRADGSDLEIIEKTGVDGSSYIDVVALIKGANAGVNTRGYYWFDDDEAGKKEFINGEVLRIGERVAVADGEMQEGILHLQFMETDEVGYEIRSVESSYYIRKSYDDTDLDDRMRKPRRTLGALYSSYSTTFRLWSPDSSDVKVTVGGKEYTMNLTAVDGYSGVYEVTVNGDLAGSSYQFTVGGAKVRDPYGRMVANGSTTANVVMDMSQTDPVGGWVDRPELVNREDSIVYEVHVRDFTIDPTSGVDADKKGRYLGMVQTGTTVNGAGTVSTGIDHLKELGITHVQLLPVYDYGTCSGVDSQNSSCYNWGYDPVNYNVPEDRYTSVFGTDRYEEKIREFKTMINEFHKNGIRVVMDVVYNHTYDKSVFENITDKYYLGKNDLSGCGNAVNADNNMVWMMIRDSLDYWVSEYHIDGFRFDLAGVFSLKDFSDWGVYLNRHHPDVNLLIYGEPWTGGGDPSAINEPVRTGRMFMQDGNAHVGAFNNRVRNCLKSASDSSDSANGVSKLGFIFNQLNTAGDGNGTDENGYQIIGNKGCVFMGVKAGVRTAYAPQYVVDEWSAQGYSDPEQSVTYITAHDNLGLRDKIERASIDGRVLYNDSEVRAIQAYANSIIMISQGISFIHGGEEIGRTKKAAGESGESPMWNTYKTTSGANDFRWDLKAGDWGGVSDIYASYIKMRRAHPAFRMTTAELINNNVTLDGSSTESVVIININGAAVGDSWGQIKVVMNSTDQPVTVSGISGMKKVADGVIVGDGVVNSTQAAPRSVSIWAGEGEEGCLVGRRYGSLYLVGSFENTSWGKFVELEHKCEGSNAWWQTKEPVELDNTTEFLMFEESGVWSSRKVGYSSYNVSQASCSDKTSSGVTTGCVAYNLTEGSGTANIIPGDWQGANLSGAYNIYLRESDLALTISKP